MTTLATYFHGIAWGVIVFFLGIVAIALSGLGMLSGWLVAKYEPHLGRMAYGLVAMPALIMLAVLRQVSFDEMSRAEFWFFAIAAIVLSAMNMLSGWLVSKYRPTLGRRAYLLAAVPPVIPAALALMMMT